MSDAINTLAAQAATDYAGRHAYTYAAQDALAARILIVEEGGVAFPRGSDIGAPGVDPTGKWLGILEEAGVEAGMYSWWNAIPCGLDRPLTPADKAKGRSYLTRAIGLHRDLYVLMAVGSVTHEVVDGARIEVEVLKTRSPVRSSTADRERIRDTFVQARLDAYPLGLDRD